jgi:hypothetical protein
LNRQVALDRSRARGPASLPAAFRKPDEFLRARTGGQGATPRNDGATGAYFGAALCQLIEREGECRDASGEHDESECRDASRNQPEPSRSELPSQSE